jgi:hypothetical protein
VSGQGNEYSGVLSAKSDLHLNIVAHQPLKSFDRFERNSKFFKLRHCKSHENGSCADTAPRGGGGRIYCFAAK